jgi:hypothetical protein
VDYHFHLVLGETEAHRREGTSRSHRIQRLGPKSVNLTLQSLTCTSCYLPVMMPLAYRMRFFLC